MAESRSNSPSSRAPHVRLNSSQTNLLSDDGYNNTAAEQRSGGPRGPRSLMPQSRSPIRPSLRDNPKVNKIYTGLPTGSSETLLIPPSTSRSRRFRDEESAPSSPVDTPTRRNSFTSDGKGTDARLIGADPFADSRSPSRAGSDDDNVNTQTVSEKYNILPSAGLLLYPEDVEKDDWLHNPDPNDKEERDCNIFNRRGFVNVGGLSLFVIGLLILFIGYPVL